MNIKSRRRENSVTAELQAVINDDVDYFPIKKYPDVFNSS